MLVAEDLLLLLLGARPDGRVVGRAATDTAVAGAVLVDLLAQGSVVEVPATDGRRPRLVRRDGARSLDDVVEERLQRLDEPRDAVGTLHRLAVGLRRRLLQRLVGAGHVQVERHRVLGLVPLTRHRERPHARAAELRASLDDALGGGRRPSARDVVLLGLLDAVQALPHVLPGAAGGLDGDELRARVAAVCSDPHVPDELRQAVAAARGAVRTVVEVTLPRTAGRRP